VLGIGMFDGGLFALWLQIVYFHAALSGWIIDIKVIGHVLSLHVSLLVVIFDPA
jgi:hypothetical protein